MNGPVRSRAWLSVTVVVPVYRNAATLRVLHASLRRVLHAAAPAADILFVDDASPDDSLSVLESLAREDPRVGVLRMVRNAGPHRAVLAGLAHARGAAAVLMDADLQDPPEAVPDLLAGLREGYDAVFAGRRGRYEAGDRLLVSRAYKRLMSVIAGTPPDAGMCVAVSRRMVDRLIEFRAPRPNVVAMIGLSGLPFTSRPVTRNRRPVGASAFSAWRRLRTGVSALTWACVWRLAPALRRGGTGAAAAAPARAVSTASALEDAPR
jgi:glycosyltransferase involved in cell wall biosynthesis